MFQFFEKVMECNRVERHVGRLSHLTTVSPVLIQTETWQGEDYSRLLEHPSEKAVQRWYYVKHPAISKVLFVRVEPSRTGHHVSHPSVFLFSGGGTQGFTEDIYQLAFPNINSKQMIRMPRSACGRHRCRAVHRGTGTDVFVSSMAVFRMNDFLSNKRLVIALSLRWQEAVIACWVKIAKMKIFICFSQVFLWWNQHQAVILSSRLSSSLLSVRHFQSPQPEKEGMIRSLTHVEEYLGVLFTNKSNKDFHNESSYFQKSFIYLFFKNIAHKPACSHTVLLCCSRSLLHQ